MTTLGELLGDTAPLPLTKPLEDQEAEMESQAQQGRWITAVVLIAVVVGIAAVVAGIALGGPWRWASGAAVAVGIAVIVVPGFVKDKSNNRIEEKK